MRSNNPVLNKVFDKGYSQVAGQGMTVEGVMNKALLAMVPLLLAAAWGWGRSMALGVPPMGMLIGASIVGLILALVTTFKVTWSPITTPIYAGVEGLVLGILSAYFEMMYPGVVFQAIVLTFGLFSVALIAYRTGAIRVTDKLRAGIVMATGGIFVVYLISMLLGFFGMSVPMIHQGGPVGIIFSLVVLGIATMNLLLDFDMIERGVQQGFPKFMEWYAAFGLLVTLVWIYIEALKLMAKLRGSRR